MNCKTSMHHFSSSRATVAGLLLAALGLTGCGTSPQDATPSPDVNPVWVTSSRKNAAKATDAKAGGADSGASDTTAGWGSLKGRFIVTGDLPALREITVTANPEYCESFKASGALRNETVVV